MKFFWFLALLFVTGFANGQDRPSVVKPLEPDTGHVELQVGDTMEIGLCDSGHFKHLDFFRKTRWQGGEEPYDTATGIGFYHSFFTSGDFNAVELPCSYSGSKFTVLGMEVLVNKNTGEDMPVMYLVGPDPNSVIWVDFNEALESGEVGLPGLVGLTDRE